MSEYRISLDDIFHATGGQLFGDVAASQFTGLCLEVSRLRSGQLFAALPDSTGSTVRAVRRAIAAGASGIICEQPPDVDIDGVTVVVVGDVEKALTQWASYMLRRCASVVVAVLGPDDASQTGHAVTSVLQTQYSVHHEPSDTRGRLGLAQSVEGLTERHDIAVVDIVPGQASELGHLLSAAAPHVVVLTGTGEHVTPAVLERLEALLPHDTRVVVNADQPALEPLHGRGLTFSARGASRSGRLPDLNVEAVAWLLDGVAFHLGWGSRLYRNVFAALPGFGGLRAALVALAVGSLFDIPPMDMFEALGSTQPLPGRMQPLPGTHATQVIDMTGIRAALPAAEALRWLPTVDLDGRRRVLFLGETEPLTEAQMRAAQSFDVVVTVGDQAAPAVAVLRAADDPPQAVELLYRSGDALGAVTRHAQSGDVVMLLGSGLEPVLHHLTGEQRTPPPRIIDPARRSWLEVDLNAIVHNVEHICRRIGGEGRLIAVLAGNAYGHGATAVASAVLNGGADRVAVTTYEEALALREAGIEAPILILGYVPPALVEAALRRDFVLSVNMELDSEMVMQALRTFDGEARLHIRVDTGQGGAGIPADKAVAVVRTLLRRERTILEGIYTQFSLADDPTEVQFTAEQRDRFDKLLATFKAAGVSFPYVHIGDSAAVLERRDPRFQTARSGLLLYGVSPSPMVPAPVIMRPSLTWKTRIAQIKLVGHGRLAGHRTRARRDMRVAVLPVGYADGFRTDWGHVLVHGQRADLLHSIGMHTALVDVTDIPEATPGDEVVLIGAQGPGTIAVEDIALRLGIRPAQVLTHIDSSLPRFYAGG